MLYDECLQYAIEETLHFKWCYAPRAPLFDAAGARRLSISEPEPPDSFLHFNHLLVTPTLDYRTGRVAVLARLRGQEADTALLRHMLIELLPAAAGEG